MFPGCEKVLADETSRRSRQKRVHRWSRARAQQPSSTTTGARSARMSALPSADPLLALGIVSAPTHAERRAQLRPFLTAGDAEKHNVLFKFVLGHTAADVIAEIKGLRPLGARRRAPRRVGGRRRRLRRQVVCVVAPRDRRVPARRLHRQDGRRQHRAAAGAGATAPHAAATGAAPRVCRLGAVDLVVPGAEVLWLRLGDGGAPRASRAYRAAQRLRAVQLVCDASAGRRRPRACRFPSPSSAHSHSRRAPWS